MTRRRISPLLFVFLLFSHGCNGIPGLPSLQDGTWLGTPSQVGAIGTATYIVQISLDKLVRINVNGAEWTIQQSFNSSRTGTRVIWKAIAAPPSGSIISLTNIEYTLDVTPQVDGTLTGTASQAIPVIPGITSIPTTSFQIVLRRI